MLERVQRKNVLLITEKNKLKQLYGNEMFYDTLVFDDVDFAEFNREQLISIFDLETDREVRVLYQYITIPSSIKRVIVRNHHPRDFYSKFAPELQETVTRRLDVHEITEHTFERKLLSILGDEIKAD
jgi:hypothetical protein